MNRLAWKDRKKDYCLILFFSFFAVSCAPKMTPTPESTIAIGTIELPPIINLATSEPTKTPKPTDTPTPEPTPWIYPTPYVKVEATAVPDPAIEISQTFTDDYSAFVLLGSDWGSWRFDGDDPNGSNHTDVFVIAIIRHKNPGGISLISIPRDLHVFIPGYGMSRINSAYWRGGAEMVMDTIRYNFGIKIDGYAYIRMEAFIDFVDDALDGITVTVRERIHDECFPTVINFFPGAHEMDGVTALCYARARNYGNGGWTRMNRQIEVLEAMRDRFVKIATEDFIDTAIKLLEWVDDVHIATDMGAGDFLKYGPATINGRNLIKTYIMNYDVGLVQWTHPKTGAWLLIPPSQECMFGLMDAAVEGSGWYYFNGFDVEGCE